MNIKTANRLVELRKKHGYSQEELAAALGLSRQSISKWERSEASPDTDNLIALAKLYNMSLDELLGIKEENYTEEDLSSSKDQRQEESPKQTENSTSEEAKEKEDVSQEDETKDEDESSFNYYKQKSEKNGGIHFTNIHIDEGGAKKSSMSFDQDGMTINGKRYGYTQGVSFDDTGMTLNGKHYEFKDGYHYYSDNDDFDFDDDETPDSMKFRFYLRKNPKIKHWKAFIGISEGIMFLLALVAYLLIGFLIPDGSGWRWGWTLFFLAEVVPSLFRAILDRKFTSFNIVFAILFVYLFLGTYMGLWHPTWIMFIAIPIYYCIFGPIDSLIWQSRVAHWIEENHIEVEATIK